MAIRPERAELAILNTREFEAASISALRLESLRPESVRGNAEACMSDGNYRIGARIKSPPNSSTCSRTVECRAETLWIRSTPGERIAAYRQTRNVKSHGLGLLVNSVR